MGSCCSPPPRMSCPPRQRQYLSRLHLVPVTSVSTQTRRNVSTTVTRLKNARRNARTVGACAAERRLQHFGPLEADPLNAAARNRKHCRRRHASLSWTPTARLLEHPRPFSADVHRQSVHPRGALRPLPKPQCSAARATLIAADPPRVWQHRPAAFPDAAISAAHSARLFPCGPGSCVHLPFGPESQRNGPSNRRFLAAHAADCLE